VEKSKSRLFHLAWKSRQKRGIPTFHTASTAAGYSFLVGLTGSDRKRREWLPLSLALTAAARQRGACNGSNANISTYVPRTPASSAYMNALQRYLNAMASTFHSSAQPANTGTPGPAFEVNVSPLMDPDSFARAGKDSVSQLADDLLDHCPEAVQYVESKDGLVADFDNVFAQYQIKKNGLASIPKIKGDLLDDTWWARSSGAELAIEVKAMANLLTDIFGAVSPEGDVVKGIQQVQDVTPSQQTLDTVGQFREYVENIKSTYEQKGDVKEAAKKATVTVTEKALERTKYKRFVPFLSFAMDLQDRAGSLKDAYQLEAEVEYQVRRLDAQISEYQNQIDNYRQTIEAMNAIHDTVIGVCVQKSVPINNGLQQ
jgi:hypothetical protein